MAPTKPTQAEVETFDKGIQTFSLLFTRWMDTNEWSHPTMVALAKACLNGTSWLHSSQISGLRHAKLRSPGPRTFIAIERLNYHLYRYKTNKILLPNTPSSNAYQDPYVITENGSPPSLGWWVEVFCGVITPSDIDLNEHLFTDSSAHDFSAKWAKYFRRQIIQKDYDIVTDLNRIISTNYPAGDDYRILKLTRVVMGSDTWTPTELALELPAITVLTGAVGGPATETDLLAHLSSLRTTLSPPPQYARTKPATTKSAAHTHRLTECG